MFHQNTDSTLDETEFLFFPFETFRVRPGFLAACFFVVLFICLLLQRGSEKTANSWSVSTAFAVAVVGAAYAVTRFVSRFQQSDYGILVFSMGLAVGQANGGYFKKSWIDYHAIKAVDLSTFLGSKYLNLETTVLPDQDPFWASSPALGPIKSGVGSWAVARSPQLPTLVATIRDRMKPHSQASQ